MRENTSIRKLGQQIGYDIRQGIIQQWKKYAMLLAVYIVSIVHFILICKMSKKVDSYTSADMIMWMLKGVKKFDANSRSQLDIPTVYMFPNIIIAFIIGNYVIKDLYGYGKSILVKAESRINWWLSKCIWCVLSAFVSYGMMYIVIAVAGVCTGSFSLKPTPEIYYHLFSMDKQMILQYADVGSLLAGVVITSFIMTVTLNIIQITVGLIVSPTLAYMAIIVLLVLGVFMDNPLVITVYCMAIRSVRYMPYGYKLLPAVIIMCAMILLCVIAGAIYSSKMDIINKKADWQNPD